MSIDERIIDDVSRATDIVQVIASYVSIKKAGANYKALCPFHQEKTPSFMISPQKQIYHCFGCGAGGNVFSFLMKYENMTFPEAVRYCAQQAGISIPEKKTFSKEKISKARIISDIYHTACEYYRASYVDNVRGKIPREYLEMKRGFSSETCTFFKIGYAGSEWRGLLDYLRKKGFQENAILESGLVVSPSSGQPYDFFRGKVIFPIVNIKGKVVAFGGRTLGTEEPKYINSPETEYFRKRYELYGLNYARREIHQAGGTVIVVEGYVDVMRLVQVGIKNVIAPLGTSLTQEQVRLMRRYADKALIIFDGDTAGINASLRSLDIFLEEALCAEVVTLPEGYDPDSFISEKGRDAFVHVLDTAKDVFDFKLDILMKKYKGDNSLGLIKLTNEMLDTLRLVQNTILLDRYVKKLSEQLGIHESSIRRELSKSKRAAVHAESAFETPEKQKGRVEHYEAELNFLHIVINEPSLLNSVFQIVTADDFARGDAREIFLLLKQVHSEGVRDITFNILANRITHEETKTTLSKLPFLAIDEETKEEALNNRLREMKLQKCDRQLKEIHKEIVHAESNHDDERRLQLQQMQIALQREKQKLKSKDRALIP